MVSVGPTGANNPLLQIVTASTSAKITLTTTVPINDTVPVNTDGTEVLTATITPKNTNNILYILFTGLVGAGGSETMVAALFQDSTANALASMQTSFVSASNETPILVYKMTAGTTSATTFKVRIGPGPAQSAIWLNSDAAGTRLFGGVASTKLTVYEYQV